MHDLSSAAGLNPLKAAEDLRHYAACKWSPELISSLDWRRIAEITRAMAQNAGYELSGTSIDLEAGCEFTMSCGFLRRKQDTIVRLAQWNQWMASSACLDRFAQTLQSLKNTTGIFVAPGGFAPAARHLAQMAHIELVDAESLAAKLNSLPSEHSDFFFDIGTAGNASTPSCPSCLTSLTQNYDVSKAVIGDFLSLPDITYRQSDIVAEPVAARRLEVLQHCEVRFLREVHAQDIVVHGMADGDFVCEGTLLLNPGGIVHGSVAARSVLVRPGGALHGETRILDGSLEPRFAPPGVCTWKCANPYPKQRCKSVRLLPHG